MRATIDVNDQAVLRARTSWTRPSLARVPEITIFFWVIKGLSTAMGESTSDYLVHVMPPVLAVLLGFIAFLGALALQLRRGRYVAPSYWLAVVMVGVFGTMAADVLHVVRPQILDDGALAQGSIQTPVAFRQLAGNLEGKIDGTGMFDAAAIRDARIGKHQRGEHRVEKQFVLAFQHAEHGQVRRLRHRYGDHPIREQLTQRNISLSASNCTSGSAALNRARSSCPIGGSG